MTTFIFARHGKSQANADNIIAEESSPLTREGESQARKLGRDIKKKHKIAVIATSPLVRARETAKIIAKQLNYKKDIEVIDDLRERGLGELVGHPKEQPSGWYATVDGEADVEPRGIVIARAESALSTIKKLADAGDGDVLVIGHAISGYYLLQVAAGKRYFEQFDPPKIPVNAAAATVEINQVKSAPADVRPKVVLYGAVTMLGLALLIVGITMVANRPAPQAGVKSQNIPLAPEDYNGDPNLQSAIQKQLQQQSGGVQSDSGASNALQPVQGIPAN